MADDDNVQRPGPGPARTFLRSITSSLTRLPSFFRRNRNSVSDNNNESSEENLPELVEDESPVEQLPLIQNNNDGDAMEVDGEAVPDLLPAPPRRTIIFTFEDMPSVIFIASGDFSSNSSLRALVELIRRMNIDDVLNESFLLHQRQRSGAAPAAPEQLESLKERPVEATEIGELCTVCQDNLQENDRVIRLPCDHCYHPDCALAWLKEHNSCPLCRAPLPSPSPSSTTTSDSPPPQEEPQQGATSPSPPPQGEQYD